MIKAVVHYDKVIGDRELETLEAQLAGAIAEAFDCDDDGGSLAANDVNVHYVQNSGRDSVQYPIIIDIDVNFFQSVMENFDERCRQLRRVIKRLLGSTRFAIRPQIVEAKWLTSEDDE